MSRIARVPATKPAAIIPASQSTPLTLTSAYSTNIVHAGAMLVDGDVYDERSQVTADVTVSLREVLDDPATGSSFYLEITSDGSLRNDDADSEPVRLTVESADAIHALVAALTRLLENPRAVAMLASIEPQIKPQRGHAAGLVS